MTPFELVLWAIGIGVAWLLLTAMTGVDDFLRKLIGRKDRSAALEAKIEVLEKRVAQLEKANSELLSVKGSGV